jgi:hypothetical protein
VITITTDRLIEFLAGPGGGTIRTIAMEEIGRDVFVAPSPSASDAVGAIMLAMALDGRTGDELRGWLHDSDEAAAFRKQPLTPRLHVDGLRFVTETGEPWQMAFLSGFRDYERFLRGEDIAPLLKETRDLGANGRRVFGAFDFGSPEQQRLYPREHADYYDRLPQFFALFQSYGLYLQFTAFADTQRSVPSKSAQSDHWQQVCAQTRAAGPNVLLEFVNEQDAHDNHADFEPDRPDGVCASRGSNGAGSDPPGPYWDYADLHAERRADFSLATTTVHFAINGYGEGFYGFHGHKTATSFAGTRRATVNSEPPGFADATQPGRRTCDPVVAYQLGLGCRWGAGGTAHSECGIQSVALTATQRSCVAAFIRGVRGDPL